MLASAALGLLLGGAAWAELSQAPLGFSMAPALGDPPGPERLPRLRQQADAGNLCAQAALGYLQALGIAMPATPGAGRAVVADAAARGCKRAHYLIARLEESGPTAEHRERARSALLAGAGAGDGQALNHLGTLVEIGGDTVRARSLYREAQSAGNRAATQNLLRLRRLEEMGPEREPFEELERRARAGDAQAQYRVARRIHRGEGRAVDYVAAWHWYRESARQGFKPAHEMIALVLAQPSAKNGKITAKWFASLAFVDVASDPMQRQRGLRQPVVDEDPFYDMR